MAAALAIPLWLLAAEGTAGTYSDIITALTTALTTSGITGVIVAGLGAALSFVLLWFGIRKVTQIFMAGFRRGRVTTG